MTKSTTQMKCAANISYVSRVLICLLMYLYHYVSNLLLLHTMMMMMMIQIRFRKIESYATGNTDFASSARNSLLTYG